MFAFAAWTEPMKVGLLTALFLCAAVLGVRLARLAHVPRVVGYLVAGLAVRLLLEWFVGGAEVLWGRLGGAIDVAMIVKTMALSLILFAVGATFTGSHLRAVREHIWKLMVAEVVTVSAVVFLATWLAGRGRNAHEAAFMALAAIATAPAATLLVLRQYGAKGPMTDHILAMLGLNNLVAIILFYAAFLIFAELGPQAGGIAADQAGRGVVAGILQVTIGSVLIGSVLGLILSVAHVKLTAVESLLLLFGVMLGVSITAKDLGLNHLIICLFMGVVFTNFSIQPYKLLDEVEIVSRPIYALFFVLAGFALEVWKLWEVGVVGGAFLLSRAAAKIAGAYIGVRWIGPNHNVPLNLGTATLCQAGVAIGLGKYLVEHWGRSVDGVFRPDPGAVAVNAVLLASVTCFELVGPLMTRRAAVRAGEVKALALVERPGGSFREMRALLTRFWHALTATRRPPAAGPPPAALIARKVMRTNVEYLRETANMSQVLKFVERSRFNHFFVVNAEGGFVGTINFRDLRNLMFNPMLAQVLNASDMASTSPPMVLADQPLSEILQMFHRHDVGSLPVVDGADTRRLLGVVEQRDVLHAMHLANDEEESSH